MHFEDKGDHNHDTEVQGASGLTAGQKEFLTAGLTALTPKQMVQKLLEQARKEGWKARLSPIPNDVHQKVKDWAHYERSKLQETKLYRTIEGFKKRFDDNPYDPNKFDAPAFLGMDISQKHQTFRWVLTTPRLLKNFSRGPIRCFDGTYKMNQKAIPTLVAGVVDYTHKFYLVAVGCMNGEREEDWAWFIDKIMSKAESEQQEGNMLSLIDDQQVFYCSDAASAIRNAVKDAFNVQDSNCVMCWFHVMKAIKEKLPHILVDKSHRETIKDCVRVLHNEPVRQVYDALLVLFKEYLTKIGEEKFWDYFDKTWIKQHPGWVRSHVHAGLPLTNNPLESFNAKLKSLSHHKRRNLGHYMEEMIEHLRTESVMISDRGGCDLSPPPLTSTEWGDAQDYRKRCENHAKEDKKTHKRWALLDEFTDDLSDRESLAPRILLPARSAYFRWRAESNKRNVSIKSLQLRDSQSFSALYLALEAGADDGVRMLRSAELDFIDASKILRNFHVLSPLPFHGSFPHRCFTCTCKKHQDTGVCKHSLAWAVELKIVAVPDMNAIVDQSRQRRQGGRPTKTRSALSRQPGEELAGIPFPDFAGASPQAPGTSSAPNGVNAMQDENNEKESESDPRSEGGEEEHQRTDVENDEVAA